MGFEQAQLGFVKVLWDFTGVKHCNIKFSDSKVYESASQAICRPDFNVTWTTATSLP